MGAESRERFDAVVIGGGIVGSAVAANLARSRSVVLVEREDNPGMHTTGRSAAIFVENYGDPVIRALTMASRCFFDLPPEGFAAAPLLRRRGALTIASPERLSALDAEAVRSTARRLCGDEARRLLPILKGSSIAAALYEEAAADIDVDALQQGFLRELRAHGGAICLNAPVEQLVWSPGGWWQVVTPGLTLRADIVVNAAGAWAGDVGRMAGASNIPLEPRRRTAVLIPAPDHSADNWPFVVDIDETVYFKPDAGNLLVSPADETPSPPCDAQPEEIDVAVAIHRFELLTGMEVRRVLHRWAGLRVFVPDRLPVIGFDGRAPNFFWCAALGGFGIQTAPAVGRLASALVTRTCLPADLLASGVDPAAVAATRPALAAELAPPGNEQ